MDKEKFLREDYLKLLEKIPADREGAWGVLSAQGMIEHMTDSIGVGWGRISDPVQTPPEYLEKFRSFALSDKEFKPGTKNSLMSEQAAPLRKKNIEEARAELKAELELFFHYWKKNPGAIVTNPFFGDFNYDQWLHLLHKHAVHHLKQFGIEQ
jgi:hypothetical protein